MKKNLQIKNIIHKDYLKKNISKKLSEDFEKFIEEITDNVDLTREAYNVLSNHFKFNFNLSELKKFKKFKSIAIIGMGGSILGSEAIYNCFKKKIKKKVYFFDDINSEKILSFKKKNTSKTLFLIISKSGNTAETLSNFLALNIIKKKNKKYYFNFRKK